MNKYAAVVESFWTWGPTSALVAVGGALGTLARYGVDVWMMPPHGLEPGFPWATFLINVSGSALLGFIMAWVEESETAPGWLRPFAGIGFCGGFTTFSTFNVEILLLVRSGHSHMAISYMMASLVFGILAVTVATAVGVRLFKDPKRVRGAA